MDVGGCRRMAGDKTGDNNNFAGNLVAEDILAVLGLPEGPGVLLARPVLSPVFWGLGSHERGNSGSLYISYGIRHETCRTDDCM